MFLIKALLYVLFFPFILLYKLFFWWLPTGGDSFDDSDEEFMFWRDHGHKY